MNVSLTRKHFLAPTSLRLPLQYGMPRSSRSIPRRRGPDITLSLMAQLFFEVTFLPMYITAQIFSWCACMSWVLCLCGDCLVYRLFSDSDRLRDYSLHLATQ